MNIQNDIMRIGNNLEVLGSEILPLLEIDKTRLTTEIIPVNRAQKKALALAEKKCGSLILRYYEAMLALENNYKTLHSFINADMDQIVTLKAINRIGITSTRQTTTKEFYEHALKCCDDAIGIAKKSILDLKSIFKTAGLLKSMIILMAATFAISGALTKQGRESA